MVERTGSFGLMNLAEDFGVDYGDVLVCAENLRRSRRGEGHSDGQLALLVEATDRIGRTTTRDGYFAFMGRLVDHANARWGKQPSVFVPAFVVSEGAGHG